MIEAAADVLRPDSVLPSAVRWVRRRLTLVHATLLTVVTLLPDLVHGDAHLAAVRAASDTAHALVTLRARAAGVLPTLPRPLGFAPHLRGPRTTERHPAGFPLDVNDFNDIANGCNGCGLRAYVFHVQINDEYLPPTRRSVAKDLWWTDVWTLDEACKAVRQRRGEDKRAGYCKPSAFKDRETFVEELRNSAYVGLKERVQAGAIPLL